MSKQRHKRKVAWLGIVQMGGNPKKIEWATMFVQQGRASKVVDTESKVVKELVFTFLGTKANLRKAEQALNGIDSGGCVLRPLEEVEETKNKCRRHWEVGTKRWKLGKD